MKVEHFDDIVSNYFIVVTTAKPGFKLAAYGVKQGGIGSLLAGGIPVLRPGGAKKTHSQDSISKQETPTVSSA